MDILIALIPALIFFYFFDYRSAVFSRKSFSSCFNFKNWACNQLQFVQVGVILSTFGSIFILKESKTKKELCFVIVGIILIISGAFLPGILKNA